MDDAVPTPTVTAPHDYLADKTDDSAFQTLLTALGGDQPDASSTVNGLLDHFSNPNTVGGFINHVPLTALALGAAPRLPAWSGPSIGTLSADRKERIAQVYDAALRANGGNETLARLATAQAVLESGSGLNSGLAQRNNFFGIKGVGTDGTANFQTREYAGGWQTQNAGFAANRTPEDSFLQWSDLMRRNYQGVMTATNFDDAARALMHGRLGAYATDPDYVQKLAQINSGIVGPIIAARAAAPAQTVADAPRPGGRPRLGDLRVAAANNVPADESAQTKNKPAPANAGSAPSAGV